MSALRPNQRERASSRAGATGGPPTSHPNGILNEIIDPTKTGKYPVILSDTLRGGTQTDVFTAVRYNHKPQQSSSDAATAPSRLKPATPGNESNFHLSLSDNHGGKYTYSGSRTSDSSQYVLYFDPAKKAFILDRINSTFHMNLTSTPDNTDADALREQFQHLDTSPQPSVGTKSTAAKPSVKPSSLKSSNAPATTPATPTTASAKGARKKGPSATSAVHPSSKPEKKKEAKVVQLALPQNNRPPAEPKTTTTTTSTPAEATKPKRDKRSSRRREMVEDEEDDDDDDDEDIGLTIEYPDDPPRSRGGADFSPAFPPQQLTVRRFSEFLRDSEADDADGESEPEEDGFKLPSPVSHRLPQYGHVAHAGHDGDDDDDDDDDEDHEFEDVQVAAAGRQQQEQQQQQQQHAEAMDVDAGDDDELDLEAELEDALEQAANSGDAGEESEVSEED